MKNSPTSQKYKDFADELEVRKKQLCELDARKLFPKKTFISKFLINFIDSIFLNKKGCRTFGHGKFWEGFLGGRNNEI
jgi:hypothetical protein